MDGEGRAGVRQFAKGMEDSYPGYTLGMFPSYRDGPPAYEEQQEARRRACPECWGPRDPFGLSLALGHTLHQLKGRTPEERSGQ